MRAAVACGRRNADEDTGDGRRRERGKAGTKTAFHDRAAGRVNPRLYALGGALLISFSAVLVRAADVAPAVASFYRTLYASPLLLLLWWAGRQRDARSRSQRRHAFVAGVVLSLDFFAWHTSIKYVGAGLSTVLANTQVLFVGLLAWLIYRERPRLLALLLVPLVLVGVALLSGVGQPDAYGEDPLRGVLFGLGAGVAYASFLLLFRASNRGTQAPPAGPLLDATLGALLGSALLIPLAGNLDGILWRWPAHGWLLLVALLVQVGGWLLVTVALPRLPALDTSVILLVQPLLAIFWGGLFFRERLAPPQLLGSAIVLGGVLLLSRLGSVRRPISPLKDVPAPHPQDRSA